MNAEQILYIRQLHMKNSSAHKFYFSRFSHIIAYIYLYANSKSIRMQNKRDESLFSYVRAYRFIHKNIEAVFQLSRL